MTEPPVAERVAATLAERGLTLGTVECGTGGIVSHHLFETEDGPAVLGDSLATDTVEEAVDFLGLPWQQFKKAGEFSAKAARAAARAGREMLEVDWCLAVWALPLSVDATTVHEAVHLGLNTGQDLLEETVSYDGPAGGMGQWLAEQALAFVGEALAQ
jgi:nicotinamide mononucleotide (NMN) deamidase PncC